MDTYKKRFHYQLEKEADANGVPVGQSIGIDIPPPRPKRKPSNPYPRNSMSPAPTWAASRVRAKDGKLLSSASSSDCKRVANLQKEPPRKGPTGEEKQNNVMNQDGHCSAFFTLLKEDHCFSGYSANSACSFREFGPSVKEVKTQDPTNESHVGIELRGNQNLKKTDAKRIAEDNSTNGASKLGNNNIAFQKELVQGEKADDLICAFHHNPEDYKSFHHISSTFSSLVVSSLQQNPAAHAAACSAATRWPYANAKNREDPPSMAAITAATVTAASAWWAAQGLLPLQTAFSCPPLSISKTGAPVPSTDTGQAPPAKRERGQSSLQIPSFQVQQSDPKRSQAVEAQHSNNAKPNTPHSEKDIASTEEVHDSNTAKSRKQIFLSNQTENDQVDGSSHGSNTPSSTEEETDTLEKHHKGKVELKDLYINHPGAESTHRYHTDSGNEVSIEGNGHQKDIMEEEE